MGSYQLGQYYPTKSFLHDLDGRSKLFALLLFLIVLYQSHSFLVFAGLTGLFLVLWALSRVPWQILLRPLRAIRLFFWITFFLDFFWPNPGELTYALPGLSFLSFSLESLGRGFFFTWRLALMVLTSNLLVCMATAPPALAQAMEKSLSWLCPTEKSRRKVRDFSLLLTLALNFIPHILEDAQKIQAAQISRGADYSGWRKIKTFSTLLIPLFFASFRRAQDLAVAMQARGFVPGAQRGSLYPAKFAKEDWYFVLIFAASMGALVCLA